MPKHEEKHEENDLSLMVRKVAFRCSKHGLWYNPSSVCSKLFRHYPYGQLLFLYPHTPVCMYIRRLWRSSETCIDPIVSIRAVGLQHRRDVRRMENKRTVQPNTRNYREAVQTSKAAAD